MIFIFSGLFSLFSLTQRVRLPATCSSRAKPTEIFRGDSLCTLAGVIMVKLILFGIVMIS